MFDVRLVEIRVLFATFDRLQGFDQRLSQFGSVTSVKDVPRQQQVCMGCEHANQRAIQSHPPSDRQMTLTFR